MATTFSQIEDLAMVTIKDYKLDKLYCNDPQKFETVLAGIMVRAVPLFNNSVTSLEYDLTTNSFTADLSLTEQNILAMLFVQIWLESKQNNLTQIASTMTPSDAKRTNVSQMIAERQNLIEMAREKNSQAMMDYAHKTVDWISMANGNFF